MLFNSAGFIFGFVPVVLLGFWLLGRLGPAPALAWLCAASLVFYGWQNPAWLPLLLASIAFNLGAARLLTARLAVAAFAPAGPRWLAPRTVLILAVAANLAVLVHYKYWAFLVSGLPTAGVPEGLAAEGADLPPGISFFTFTQIAFLVDVHRRRVADLDPLRYGLFVSYYPHLIAGPILHHAQVMPQFARRDIFRCDAGRWADGTVIFVLGLFKKVVLADQFALYVGPAFDAAGTQGLSFFVCWGAALAYTLQLYFDFSGYSDMAIGLALMIGVQLPLNFHSPYKARNIADFWRRWHMTLSRFLRDYLYIPLGGNRGGAARRYVNLTITMLLGGAWHGAGWTFIVWGGLHAAYLVVHGLWLQALARLAPAWVAQGVPGLGWLAWPLTFAAVVVAWVFFRAADLHTAFSLLKGMAGLHGSVLPEQIIHALPALAGLAQGAPQVPYLGDGSVMGAVEMLVMLSGGMALAVFAPALHELRNRTRYLLVVPCAALALQQVVYGRASPFLYFQF